MLRALDRDPHATRLRDLLQRFRDQELAMTTVLHQLQAELEHWHREANHLRVTEPVAGDAVLRRCSQIQEDCDILATELVHVRMAIAGTGEELTDHDGRHMAIATNSLLRAALA